MESQGAQTPLVFNQKQVRTILFLSQVFTSVKTYYFWPHIETTEPKENILTPHKAGKEKGEPHFFYPLGCCMLHPSSSSPSFHTGKARILRKVGTGGGWGRCLWVLCLFFFFFFLLLFAVTFSSSSSHCILAYSAEGCSIWLELVNGICEEISHISPKSQHKILLIMSVVRSEPPHACTTIPFFGAIPYSAGCSCPLKGGVTQVLE